jgi:predicted O-methyltransferase YrrM
MKDRLEAILRPAQAEYLERLLPPRDPVLRAMEERAERDGVPISDPEVGRLLEILARGVAPEGRPPRFLEIGTAIGYGTLCLLRAHEQARVVSIDPDASRLAQAREFLAQAGALERAELLEAPALQALPGLAGAFDLVYIDALKVEYRRYLDLALPLLEVGGFVVVDNLLWKGTIAEPAPNETPESKAIGAFNVYLMAHPQLRALVLPLGDGVGVAVKTKKLIRELGGPF